MQPGRFQDSHHFLAWHTWQICYKNHNLYWKWFPFQSWNNCVRNRGQRAQWKMTRFGIATINGSVAVHWKILLRGMLKGASQFASPFSCLTWPLISPTLATYFPVSFQCRLMASSPWEILAVLYSWFHPPASSTRGRILLAEMGRKGTI